MIVWNQANSAQLFANSCSMLEVTQLYGLQNTGYLTKSWYPTHTNMFFLSLSKHTLPEKVRWFIRTSGSTMCVFGSRALFQPMIHSWLKFLKTVVWNRCFHSCLDLKPGSYGPWQNGLAVDTFKTAEPASMNLIVKLALIAWRNIWLPQALHTRNPAEPSKPRCWDDVWSSVVFWLWF